MRGRGITAAVLVAVAALPSAAAAREPRPFFDSRAGTPAPQALVKTSGALTAPRAGSRDAIARGYLRDRARTLGLSGAEVGALSLAKRVDAPGGVTILRYRQSFRGIQAFDDGVRVALDRAGRVLGVTGSPHPGLAVGSITPKVSAAAARRVLARSVGGVARGGGGELTLFDSRLAWRLEYKASSTEHYVGVVDAVDGRLLWRANRVKRASANVFDYYAGAPEGGDVRVQDLTGPGWLPADAQNLSGPYARAWSDLDDDDVVDTAEEVVPEGGDFRFPFTPFDNGPPRCTATRLCSWDPVGDRDSWQVNREQATTQAFFLVNKFHDHLAKPEIGFTGFEGADPVRTQTLDGAATGPDADHVNNANMSTPPEGQSPTMQLYLFEYSESAPFFDYNGDDAATVWHEYTHGLSNRLVVGESGEGALNTAHAGAMGEAWSDWYAEDLLVREGLETDDPDVSGDIDLGEPSDAVRHATRTSAIDCPVGSTDAEACPGGGYTLGDFGRVAGAPEVHSDGEIWVQTLWDLRRELVEELGSDEAGSDAAEALITMGMRLSPPEPSMLDMRDAILQADTALNGGARRDTIWSVFARRGMGFYAVAFDGNDTKPAEDFSLPPEGAQAGTLRGTISDARSGLPLSGVRVRIGGGADVTGADGRYEIAGVTGGTYAKLALRPAGGLYDAKDVPAVAIPGGGTATRDFGLERNWAAGAGGAAIAAVNDTTGEPGCGPTELLDASPAAGWSAWNPTSDDYPATLSGEPPRVTVRLPATLDVSAIGIDPASTCGDPASTTLKGFRLEVSTNGTTFRPWSEGEFTPAQAGSLNRIEPPAAGGANVRFVRLTLLSPQNDAEGFAGDDFIDVSALEVFGAAPNVLPSGSLTAARAGSGVALTASFTDRDSRITGYEWDFDGNGSVDRRTAGPAVQHTYPVGTFTARVAAKDFRGGAGTASTTVTVAPPAPQPPPSSGGSSATPLPVISIARSGRKGRFTVRVTCATVCDLSGRVTITRKLARRLGLKRTTLYRLEPTLTSKRRQTLRITLPKAARKPKSIVVKARFAAEYGDGRGRSATRTLRVRRR